MPGTHRRAEMRLLLLQVLLVVANEAGSVPLKSLDGFWSLRNSSAGAEGQPLRAPVPGTVPGALFAAGAKPDPQFGRNQLDVFDYSTADTFTFMRTFATPAGGCAGARRCELIFDGIDTAATVAVNGHIVGKPNNMHMRWVFDVSTALTATNNVVEVEIIPATQYAHEQAAAQGDSNCTKHSRNYWPEKWGHQTQCSGYVRKNTGSFGWDCAPAYVTAGIWRSVWLRVVETAAIDVVAPQISGTIADPSQPEASNAFAVEVRVFLAVAAEGPATVSVAGSWNKDAVASKRIILNATASTHPVVLTLSAKDVALWWPHGHGPSTQTLFNLTTRLDFNTSSSLRGGGGSSSEVVQQVGFKTFEFVGSVGNNTEVPFSHYRSHETQYNTHPPSTTANGPNTVKQANIGFNRKTGRKIVGMSMKRAKPAKTPETCPNPPTRTCLTPRKFDRRVLIVCTCCVSFSACFLS